MQRVIPLHALHEREGDPEDAAHLLGEHLLYREHWLGGPSPVPLPAHCLAAPLHHATSTQLSALQIRPAFAMAEACLSCGPLTYRHWAEGLCCAACTPCTQTAQLTDGGMHEKSKKPIAALARILQVARLDYRGAPPPRPPRLWQSQCQALSAQPRCGPPAPEQHNVKLEDTSCFQRPHTYQEGRHSCGLPKWWSCEVGSSTARGHLVLSMTAGLVPVHAAWRLAAHAKRMVYSQLWPYYTASLHSRHRHGSGRDTLGTWARLSQIQRGAFALKLTELLGENAFGQQT